MRRTVVLLALTLAVGIAVGVLGNQGLTAQKPPVKVTELLKTELMGVEGKEALALFVEVAAGAATGKHYHPGQTLAYVLEGSAIGEPEGKPPEPRPGKLLKSGGIQHEH